MLNSIMVETTGREVLEFIVTCGVKGEPIPSMIPLLESAARRAVAARYGTNTEVDVEVIKRLAKAAGRRVVLNAMSLVQKTWLSVAVLESFYSHDDEAHDLLEVARRLKSDSLPLLLFLERERYLAGGPNEVSDEVISDAARFFFSESKRLLEEEENDRAENPVESLIELLRKSFIGFGEVPPSEQDGDGVPKKIDF